ncbi:transcriptional regulator, partial [Xanthomonas vasicola pv. musacearum NCPPB 4384]
ASRLAAAEEIDGTLYGQLSPRGREVVLELLAQGHYQRAHEDADGDIADDDAVHALSVSSDHDEADAEDEAPEADDAIDADADVEQVADDAGNPAETLDAVQDAVAEIESDDAAEQDDASHSADDTDSDDSDETTKPA